MSADSGDRTEGSGTEREVGGSHEDRADPVLGCGVADEGTGGFAWCGARADTADATDTVDETDATDTVDETDAADGGFEWCAPTSVDPDGNAESEDAENGNAGNEGVENRNADAATTDTEALDYSLPSDLVTTTRRSGIDDEAVARLSALRQDPGRGRWQRAAAEFGTESTADHDRE